MVTIPPSFRKWENAAVTLPSYIPDANGTNTSDTLFTRWLPCVAFCRRPVANHL